MLNPPSILVAIGYCGTAVLWLVIGLAKALRVNPEVKSECSPIGSQVRCTFLAANAVNLVLDVLVHLSSGLNQRDRQGESGAWTTQTFHIHLAQANIALWRGNSIFACSALCRYNTESYS